MRYLRYGLIAVLGIVNTLTLSVIERRQVRTMIMLRGRI